MAMTTHETVRKMTDGQRGDLTSTMAGAIPLDLSFNEAQGIIGDKGPFVAEIRAVFAKRRRAQADAVPANNEWFSLEIDNDVDPMSVVSTTVHNANGWKYRGPKFEGKQICRAKLVILGYVRNLEEARKKVDEMGCRLVEGQARKPLMARFPKPDGKGPVVFGGSEWQGPNGSARVACLHAFKREWQSDFYWSGIDFFSLCRWLVVDK